MGHPLKSEVRQKLQKWVLYDLIHDPTGFWLSWDPTDSEDIRFNRKCCKGTFKAPCLVALRMLLQLTYCCLHNVSIDCNWNKVSNLPWKKNMLY